MPQNQTRRKLGFPGMLDKQYQKHRERLIEADKAEQKAAKVIVSKQATDTHPSGWDLT